MQYEHTRVEQEIQRVIRKQFEEPLRQMLAEYLGEVAPKSWTEKEQS